MSDNDGLSESEIIKLLFKNYMNFTTTSHNKLFYQETLLSNNNNLFSSGVLINTPPIYDGAPDFTTVNDSSVLSQYLSYAALPDINIDVEWFNSKRTIGVTDSSGVFSVDSTDDSERTILRLDKIKLDYLGGGSAAFVCNDNSGVNILQNLVPPNYSTNGYSARLWYINDNNHLTEIGWLASRDTLGTTTYVGHDVSFGGALFDSKNGVVTFYDVLNDDPGTVFSDISCNFFITATKYIGSTLADGDVTGSSAPINSIGQTFHEVVTGKPKTFNTKDMSNTIFTIDISWGFDNIRPTNDENQMFNFPGNVRDRMIPYIGNIYFDISTSEVDDIDFSANITIDSDHNYTEDNKEISGNIVSNSYGDLSFVFTYRSLNLTKYSEDTRKYTINVWGENESKETNNYKLTFHDLSFASDSEALPKTLDYSMNAFETISGDLYVDVSDSDGINNKIVRFMIVNEISGFTWDNSLNDSYYHFGETITTSNFSSDGKWSFSPEISGNAVIEIKTWTDFHVKGKDISAEFYSNSSVSGFSSIIKIKVFVDAEVVMIGDLSGISQEGEYVTGIVEANDTDGEPLIFSISSQPTGGSAVFLSSSDISAEWKYTPNADFSGNDHFFIRTTDTSGGTSDVSINIFVDFETQFSGDIDVTGNGEEISGNLGDFDRDGIIKYEVISDPSYGEAEFYSDNSGTWSYTSINGYTGYDSFQIRTTDVSGGTTDASINVLVPSFFTFDSTTNINQNMKQVHSKLIGTTDATYATVDNYRWVVYKVHESGTTSYEYLPSDKSSTGTAGINLSYIMKTYFGDASENDFFNSLSSSQDYDNILVYIVAKRKTSNDYYMAKISNQLPGFDEMNPWYWNNIVTSSSISSLTSGNGVGALPDETLQDKIRNNITDTYIETNFNQDINGHEPILIYTHSDILEDHKFYFAFKN